jgi:hypothetical protein
MKQNLQKERKTPTSNGHAMAATSVSELPPLRSGFDLRPIHVGFVVNKVALR